MELFLLYKLQNNVMERIYFLPIHTFPCIACQFDHCHEIDPITNLNNNDAGALTIVTVWGLLTTVDCAEQIHVRRKLFLINPLGQHVTKSTIFPLFFAVA